MKNEEILNIELYKMPSISKSEECRSVFKQHKANIFVVVVVVALNWLTLVENKGRQISYFGCFLLCKISNILFFKLTDWPTQKCFPCFRATQQFLGLFWLREQDVCASLHVGQCLAQCWYNKHIALGKSVLLNSVSNLEWAMSHGWPLQIVLLFLIYGWHDTQVGTDSEESDARDKHLHMLFSRFINQAGSEYNTTTADQKFTLELYHTSHLKSMGMNLKDKCKLGHKFKKSWSQKSAPHCYEW